MPVNTGVTPDDVAIKVVNANGDAQDLLTAEEGDDVLAGANEAEQGIPPAEVASVDVVAAELTGTEVKQVDVRGKKFKVRSAVPGMLILQLTKAQTVLQAPGAEADPIRQAQALATTHDAITKLVAPDDRANFIEWCEDVEPPMDMEEVMGLVGTMMEAITGRPTQSV